MPYGAYKKGSKAAGAAMRKYLRKKAGAVVSAKEEARFKDEYAEDSEDSSDYGKTMKRLKRLRR